MKHCNLINHLMKLPVALLLLTGLLIGSLDSFAQRPTSKMITVVGNVTDEAYEPLPGVAVILKGTKVGVITDVNGGYTIRFAPKEHQNYVLEFSFLGMETQEIKVSTSTQVDVIMKNEASSLEEVVVNGFYTQKKSTFTGSATSIKGEELVTINPTNIMTGIAASTPGMVLQENFAAGSNPNAVPNLLIRGASSLITNDSEEGINNPLIVLDGVEISMEELYDLDTFDIERVDVLKDASATILYGEKGANGVIVIERKRIEDAKARLNYNFVPDFSIPDLTSFNLTNAQQKLELEKLAGLYDKADGSMDQAYAYKLQNIRRGIDTDWLRAPLRIPFSHSHSLAFSAKGKSVDYRANIRFNDNYGVMKGDNRRNYNIGFNVNYHVKNKLTVSFRTNYALTSSKNSPYGDFAQYSKLNPYETVFDENGEYIKNYYFDPFNQDSEKMANPLYNATLSSFSKAKNHNLTSSLDFKWNLTEYLDLSAHANMSINTGSNEDYVSPDAAEYINIDNVYKRGRYTYGHRDGNSAAGRLVLSYGRPLGKNGSMFRVSTGANLKKTKRTNVMSIAEGFLKDELNDLKFALGYDKDGKPKGEEKMSSEMGFFVNTNFGILNRYIFDASYRTSGSSRFGSDNSFAPFWSIGAGWNMHNESWLKDVSWINSLRPRYSVGYTGTVSFDYYQAKTVYEYDQDNDYFTGIGAIPVQMGNPDLKWQKKLSHNFGITGSFFDSRLDFELNYYHSTTHDLLMPINLPPSVGEGQMKVNFGQIQNAGMDFSLSGRIINTRNTSWMMTFTGGHVMDKIRNISNVLLQGQGVEDAYDPSKPNILFKEGGSQFDIYAVPSAGIDPATGREIFIRKDGSHTYTYNEDDRVAVGNTNPILQGSWMNTIRYKGLSLSIVTSYTFGADYYNSTLQTKVENITAKKNVDARAYTDRWKKPGDLVRFLAINNVDEQIKSQRFVEKRNELYISNINLSYDFRSRVLDKIGFKKLCIGIGMSDIGYISTVKFERGTSYPYCRSINLIFRPTF